MDFETKEEKLRFELLEKAYYDAFVKKETKPVALFAMNLFMYGKKEVAMGLIASVAL